MSEAITNQVDTPRLTEDQIEYRVFEIVKYYMLDSISKKKCYTGNFEDTQKELFIKEMKDELVLLKYLTDSIKKHNTNLDVTQKRINNFSNRNGNFRHSETFKTLPDKVLNKITEVVIDNPEYHNNGSWDSKTDLYTLYKNAIKPLFL